jgi:guanylate kinase
MNTQKRKKLLLLGKSASGKDTLRDMLVKRGLKTAISYTSRPKRENEVEGLNYHYITLEEFERRERENFFLESEPFRVQGGDIWKYGRSYESIENGEVFIATVTGVSNMIKKTNREQFYIVELVCDDNIRYERAMKRGDNLEEAKRRLGSDDRDFSAPRDFEVDEVLDTTDLSAYDNFIDRFLAEPLMLTEEMQYSIRTTAKFRH